MKGRRQMEGEGREKWQKESRSLLRAVAAACLPPGPGLHSSPRDSGHPRCSCTGPGSVCHRPSPSEDTSAAFGFLLLQPPDWVLLLAQDLTLRLFIYQQKLDVFQQLGMWGLLLVLSCACCGWPLLLSRRDGQSRTRSSRDQLQGVFAVAPCSGPLEIRGYIFLSRQLPGHAFHVTIHRL